IVRTGHVWIIALLLTPSPAFGQASNRNDAHTREVLRKRAERDRAVARLGPQSSGFVETYGELAVAATVACSEGVGRKVANHYKAGRPNGVPNIPRLLAAIANHGDMVANFAMEHEQELCDEWCAEAFLRDPLTYAAKLKRLDEGAAQWRQY